GQQPCSADDLLEIIDDQQGLLVFQPSHYCLHCVAAGSLQVGVSIAATAVVPDSEGLGDGRGHQFGIYDVAERDKADEIVEPVFEFVSSLDGDASLAAAASSG